MKITINLSPAEIQKVGEVTHSSYADCWNKYIHTEDDITYALHKLINMLCEIQTLDEDGNVVSTQKFNSSTVNYDNDEETFYEDDEEMFDEFDFDGEDDDE